MDTYCYNLTIQSNIAKYAGTIGIRTNKPVGQQDYLLAKQIMQKTYVSLANDTSAKVKNIAPVTSPGSIYALQNSLTIARPFGGNESDRVVYVMPVGGVRVTLLLKGSDTENSDGDDAYVLFVPGNIINIDCSGQAVIDLLKQITSEYLERCYGDCKINTWRDIAKIPVWFTEPYGVRIEPMENFMTISVAKDAPILTPETNTEGKQ